MANRTLLYDRLEQAINYAERSRRLVVTLLLDMDRFKIVNSRLSHSAGNELLQQPENGPDSTDSNLQKEAIAPRDQPKNRR